VFRPGHFSTAGPPHRKDAGSFHLELDPLQQTNDQRATQPVSWVDFPGFPTPFNGVTRASPDYGWLSLATPVPLSGFLNLSAVSWHARTSRVYFAPQPFLGFSLQSVPLAGITHLSRGR